MKAVPLNKMKNIAPLFSWSNDKLIISCFQGHSGQAFADNLDFPTVALIISVGFSFIGGNPASVQAVELLKSVPAGTDLIPQPNWCEMIENILGPRAQKQSRYGFKKEPGIFNRELLEKYASDLPEGFYIKRIDNEIYDLVNSEDWSSDLVENFPSKEDFLEKGFGVAQYSTADLLPERLLISFTTAVSRSRLSPNRNIGAGGWHRPAERG